MPTELHHTVPKIDKDTEINWGRTLVIGALMASAAAGAFGVLAPVKPPASMRAFLAAWLISLCFQFSLRRYGRRERRFSFGAAEINPRDLAASVPGRESADRGGECRGARSHLMVLMRSSSESFSLMRV